MTSDNIDHAWGNGRLLDQLTEFQHRGRCMFGCLQYDRIAGGKRRTNFDGG